MTWWEEKKKKSRRAIAYYRHSAQDRQKNSIEIQRDAVRKFADENDMEIIAEFEDAGKSGLNAEGRKGFQALLERVKQRDVSNVICNDASRWGRFQDIYKSADYERQCAEYGAEVVYVVDGNLKKETHDNVGIEDDAIFHAIRRTMNSGMAGKFSAVLSKKVYDGAVKVAEQGNRAGGSAPFGTVRIEVNEQGVTIGIMKPKQHKSYPNHRVRLAPNPDGKANVVSDIFDFFVINNYSENQIATILNKRNIPAPMGGKWSENSIRHVLKNEQYAGSVVYNKTTSKLGEKKVKRNPREKWIITPNSYEPIVDRAIFDTAQEIFNIRNKRMSREEMLERIRFVFEKYHMLSHSLMKSLPDMPTRNEIIREFGSLPEAFQSLYPDVIQKVRDDVRNMIESKANEVIECDGFLVINKRFSIKIEPALPFPRGYGFQWYFRIDNRPRVDLTLGVPLRDTKGSRILGYFPFPRTLTDEPQICIADSSAFKIGLYGRIDLNFIFDLIRWSYSNNKETQNEQK